jgi:hypothetical protein
MSRHRAALGVLLAAAALAACGEGSSPQVPASVTPAPVDASADNGVMTVALNHMPHGVATVTSVPGRGLLSVNLHLYGLVPGSSHPTGVGAGTCYHQGATVHELAPMVADGHGVADATTTIPGPGGIPDAVWYLEVHNGPGTWSPDEALPLVCGDVVNSGGAASVSVPLTAGPPPPSLPGSPDQAASGHVLLQVVRGALQLTVDVTDLTPGSAHAVSVNLGSCDSPGALVHPLNLLTADANGHASSVTPLAGITSIPTRTWYIVVRRTAGPATTQTDLDPVLCGDVGGQTGL